MASLCSVLAGFDRWIQRQPLIEHGFERVAQPHQVANDVLWGLSQAELALQDPLLIRRSPQLALQHPLQGAIKTEAVTAQAIIKLSPQLTKPVKVEAAIHKGLGRRRRRFGK